MSGRPADGGVVPVPELSVVVCVSAVVDLFERSG